GQKQRERHIPFKECRGDFNLNHRMMGRFRRVLNDLALKEVYLSGRRYTWSNEQSPPTLVHLDRVLCTTDWEELHSACLLRCLASVVSDHSPLILDCSPIAPPHRRFHFEDFWIRLDGFHDVVAAAWHSVHVADPFRRFMLRM
uniref:Endonuclease/exonuclease/phosphatase domain-containing protein n=1 Tax=Aegilops tauschii subsp. strangulata TaxID=200361 RepID=A0A452Z0G7_AEGTS